MTLRKVLFWLHLSAGVLAGVVILIMSVTGVLLMYERQMTAWADGYVLSPPPGAARLSVESLIGKIRSERKALPSSVTLRADPSAPAALAFGREGTLFVDPYSGAILGEGSKRARDFFHSVTDWHRWLNAHGESRTVGKAVTGASNLLFLFIVLSGLYLWWPKNWEWRFVRKVTLFQGGLSAKARDFNWHNVIGFWSALPLAFVVGSIVPISYPWARDLVYHLTGSEPPPQSGPPGAASPTARIAPPAPSPGRPSGPPPDFSLEGLDRIWTRAEEQVPGWQSLSVRLPTTGDAPWTFSIDTSAGARRPDTRTQVSLDLRTGEVVKVEPYESQSRGRKALGWMRFIHTGEAFGFVGQTVAGLVSAGGAVLVYTGLALALRRFVAWRRRAAVQGHEGAAAPQVPLVPTPSGPSRMPATETSQE
jgi:uncharacterized iron-regulated membrane protein